MYFCLDWISKSELHSNALGNPKMQLDSSEGKKREMQAVTKCDGEPHGVKEGPENKTLLSSGGFVLF